MSQSAPEEIIDAEILSDSKANGKNGTRTALIIGGALLLLTLLGGGLWLLNQSLQQHQQSANRQTTDNQQQIGQLQHTITQFETRLDHNQQQLTTQQQQQTDQLQQFTAQQLQEHQAVEQLEQQLKQRNASLQQSIEEQQEQLNQLLESVSTLAQRVEQREQQLHHTAALRLLQIAEERLMLMGDLEGSQHAMAQAAYQLGESGNPQLIPIRQQVESELQQIQQVAPVNLEVLVQQIDQILAQVETLPFPTAASTPTLSPTPPTPSSEQTAKTWSWEGLAQRIWGDLLSLIRIEKQDQALPTIVTESEQQSARQILRLRLEQAQSALLLRETVLFQGRVHHARGWLAQFDANAPTVQTLKQQLAALSDANLNPKLPLIGEAHRQLKQLSKKSTTQ